MIRQDINKFLASLPKDVTLVVASKYLNSKDILFLYKEGVKNFGENRTDSFLIKKEELKEYTDIKWHFIGHLQTNKAKEMINKIDVLHSLDSLKLANLIEKYRETPLDTFIEVSINLEENKNGVPYYNVKEFIKQILPLKKVKLVGLMMMAKKGSMDTNSQFHKLRLLRDELEKEFNIKLPYLSMGMSEDYLEAIKEKATHIRLGRILLEQ